MKPARDDNRSRVWRLFLLVENRLLRDALAAMVRKQPDFCVVGADRYAPSITKVFVESQCDVLVADHATAVSLSTNILKDFRSLVPGARIVFLGMDEDPEAFVQAVRSGVSGYLLGEASAEETLTTIRRVASGEAVCPARLCQYLFELVAQDAQKGALVLDQRICAKHGLTPRQQQLVSFLARGMTNKEIAANLNLSEFTVKNHVHRIMRQLKAQNRYAAVQTVCEGGSGAAVA
jgi:DNA-binding NarL/FixJ family response regulator